LPPPVLRPLAIYLSVSRPQLLRGTDILYQTRGGAFFLHKEKTINEWDEEEREHRRRERHEFVPLSPESAHKWMLEGDVEVVHNPFDDPPEATAEAEPGATIYIRVPAALKRRVDEAVQESKLSGNVWAMRCVEQCLEGYERELLDLLCARAVRQITIPMQPNVRVAVDLRHRLHTLAKKMREDGAPSAFAERATLSVIFTTQDGVEHKYRDNSSLPPDQEVKSCEIRIAIDFDEDMAAKERELLA
jgi:hypothetical protein